MGFKCIFCRKDFGKNKEEFEKHIKQDHAGVVNILKDEIDKAINETNKQDDKKEVK
jgi:hypothetical protein